MNWCHVSTADFSRNLLIKWLLRRSDVFPEACVSKPTFIGVTKNQSGLVISFWFSFIALQWVSQYDQHILAGGHPAYYWPVPWYCPCSQKKEQCGEEDKTAWMKWNDKKRNNNVQTTFKRYEMKFLTFIFLLLLSFLL